MKRLLLAAAAALALTGCGHAAQPTAGETYCHQLQVHGVLFEPMSQCLSEYAAATREPLPDNTRPSHFFDSR